MRTIGPLTIRKSAFFRFANHFAASTADIPADFVPSAETITQFSDWLDDDGFEFKGKSEWMLDQLEEKAESSGYDVADGIEDLRSSIEEEKAGDFERYEPELVENLRQEILARYHGETAQIRASLAHDRQVLAAVELLSDPSRVAEILKGASVA